MMIDLFQKAQATAATARKRTVEAEYSAKDIEVLEGLEPVRKRPGMYIGGTDEKALHHLVSEILDNAMDEAVAGHATRIELHLGEGNRITVMDNGRGIPVDPHPKFPQLSALEVILTTLHSGGKFSDSAYQTAGGLHGVGISVVNALSDSLDVEIYRGGYRYTQSYSQGKPITPLIQAPLEKKNAQARGTCISFHPDPEIFGENLGFKAKLLLQMTKAKAYLFRGVKVIWKCAESLVEEGVPAETIFHYPSGLTDYLRDVLGDQPLVGDDLFAGEAQFANNEGRLEWAVGWPQEGTPEDAAPFYSFCNTIPTPQGGTHEAGFRQAMLRAFKAYGERTNNRRATIITGDDICGAASIVFSCFIKQPQFQGQTKEKLVSAHATRLVDGVIKDRLDLWLGSHPQAATALLEHIILVAEERLKRRQSKDISRSSATRRLRLPGKLADCSQSNRESSEIFLVEGDSAGGSAKQARNRATQAILPLRGKILNVAAATSDKMRNNQELSDMIIALGCGHGKDFDLSKLRYDKVIIMTDADVDGAHIASLLLTFFFQEMKPLVQGGHVYLAQPPLYRLTYGGKSAYARDDAEKEKLLKTVFKNSSKVEIGRFKGLGEMMAAQLRDTTMHPEKRTLLQVTLNPNEDASCFVDRLMGKNADSRFQFIQENAETVLEIDA